jgi:hypothetical protein
MIILISGTVAIEKYRHTGHIGRFLGPRTGNIIRPGDRWAGDNDAFTCWDEDRFLKFLGRVQDVPGCLFVACPDVVGNARATLERFEDWNREISGRGLPVAFVGQDGADDIEIPWDEFDSWFIGGTDDWKLSESSADLVHEAKARGKWVHMGRVNSLKRIKNAFDYGCDSIDGKSWSVFSDAKLPRGLPYLDELAAQGRLF